MQDLALNLDRMVAVMQRQTAQITFFWFHTEQLSPILVWIANAKISLDRVGQVKDSEPVKFNNIA
jgi:hypothetical protein